MSRTVLLLLATIPSLWACSSEPESPPAEPTREALPSELSLEAVDAGTGEAISDARLTVRYLVRSPITLDESAVHEVPSGQPYRIAHAISEDSLVVEVRLEAPSYLRLDTVVAVGRGGSGGPFRIAMAQGALHATRARLRMLKELKASLD